MSSIIIHDSWHFICDHLWFMERISHGEPFMNHGRLTLYCQPGKTIQNTKFTFLIWSWAAVALQTFSSNEFKNDPEHTIIIFQVVWRNKKLLLEILRKDFKVPFASFFYFVAFCAIFGVKTNFFKTALEVLDCTRALINYVFEKRQCNRYIWGFRYFQLRLRIPLIAQKWKSFHSKPKHGIKAGDFFKTWWMKSSQ